MLLCLGYNVSQSLAEKLTVTSDTHGIASLVFLLSEDHMGQSM